MRLVIQSKEVIENPDAAAIEQALRSLDGDERHLATLETGEADGSFLCTLGGPDQFSLEYGADGHDYVCFERTVGIEELIRVFQAYARREVFWMGEFPWEEVNRPPEGNLAKSGCLPRFLLIALAVCAGVLLACLR